MTGIIQEMHRVVTGVIGDDNQANDVVFALIKNFGGERLYIPTNSFTMRNSEINSLHSSGATVDYLAKRYQLSPKTIYRILEDHPTKAEEVQSTLSPVGEITEPHLRNLEAAQH